MLERLVAFDTTSSRSNLDLIAFVRDYLAGLGVDSVVAPNAAGDKACLYATIGPAVDGGVVLSGHTDCVPVAGQPWTSDPFVLTERDGRLYGRGSADMKGYVATALAMVPAFQAAGLKRPVHLCLSYDEEVSCLGSVDIIRRFGAGLPMPAAAIVGEPTLMRVVDAHKSIRTFETVVTGRDAHSSLPMLGANAILAAVRLVAGLDALRRELIARGDATGRFNPPYSTLHIGTIEGGTALNIVPKQCRFVWEVRGLPDYDQDEAGARVEALAAEVLPELRETAPEATIVTQARSDVPALAPAPGSAAETLVKRLVGRNATEAVSYATEAGHFQMAGVATIICGPGSIDQAHKPDEFIAAGEIEACARFMRALAADLAR